MREVFIVEAKRSPVGRRGGALAHLRPDDLLAQVLKGLTESVPSLDPALIDDVVMGCAIPEAEQGMNVARMASRLAGLPVSVPAYTLNRFCASGLQAIANGALLIASGQADCVIAGGVESMSVMPRMSGHVVKPNPRFFEDEDLHPYGLTMGLTAEHLQTRYGLTREAQDHFAFHSHEKALNAKAEGLFDAEIVPMAVMHRMPGSKGQTDITQVRVAEDEGPREDTTLQKLAALKPVFKVGGSVTAGNSAQMSDGAAALLLMSEAALTRCNLSAKARFVNYAVAGLSPELMGVGPVLAVPKVLKQAGWTEASLDWIELNEAFAVQALAVMRDLGLDDERVNPLGGAIALGHPLGATGAIRATTLVHAMMRGTVKRGLVTMCVGMGMGAAGVFEKLS